MAEKIDSRIETQGGTHISGDVNTGGGVFIGRDIGGDFVGRDKVVIGSRYTIYVPVSNFFLRYGVTIAIIVVILVSITLVIIFFWSNISALWYTTGNTLSQFTQIALTVLASILGLLATYVAARKFLQRSAQDSRMTINQLRNSEKNLFEEIDKDVDSMF